MYFSCDFETDTKNGRVWAFGCAEIESLSFYYGNSINDFFEWAVAQDNPTCYFHNLKFDGGAILKYLLNNGYEWHYKLDNKKSYSKVFTTIIDGTGKFYQFKVYIKKYEKRYKTITFLDSLKIFPNMSVDKVASAFNLPISKLKIDYDLHRKENHVLTPEEILYLKNDCTIIAMALREMHNKGLTKMTIASNGINDLKQTVGKNIFNELYPIIKKFNVPSGLDYQKKMEYTYTIENDIRESYKGGYCYLKPEYAGKLIEKNMRLYDVNSLYPSVYGSKNLLMPYGFPKAFTGEYSYDKDYPLYIQIFSCQFELKKGFLPTLQIKRDNRFIDNEYLSSNNNEHIVITLNNVDFEVFKKHYNIYDVEYIGGYKFKANQGVFYDYVQKWVEVKNEAKENGNKSMYTIAKLMLNAPYGRFGLNPKCMSKSPYLDENGILKFKNLDYEYREPLYIPVASFITAYARRVTIESGQNNFDKAVYFDTDSMYLICDEHPNNIKVSSSELGAWDCEMYIDKFKFIRQKTYMVRGGSKINSEKHDKIVCAGMPKTARTKYDENGNIKKRMNEDGSFNFADFDNFVVGNMFTGRLLPKMKEHGVVLEPTLWTMK